MNESQNLVILRGLPGSGKTTLAKQMFPEHAHHAADDFFEVLGRFDPSQLGRAHRQCQSRVQASLASGHSVVVHNTNTTHSEMKPYLQMAQRMSIDVRVVHVESGLTDEQLSVRNVHSVPLSAIRRMRARWQPYTSEEVVKNASNNLNHRHSRKKRR